MIQKSLRELRESGASQEEIQSLQNIERKLKLEMRSSGEMNSRTRRDIEAGRPVFLAQLKEKKRNRAAEHRKSRGAERAQDRLQKETEREGLAPRFRRPETAS